MLKAPQTTKDAKRYICRWLAIVGSSECIPAVAELLTDKDLSDLARIALEPNPALAAGAALRSALPKVKGKLLAGVISSIGVRRDSEAVEALGALARQDDPLVAESALAALGAIGTDEAIEVLVTIKAPAGLLVALERAKIAAAGRLLATGKRTKAASVYKYFAQAQPPKAILIAAFKGYIDASPRPEAVRVITEVLRDKDAAKSAEMLTAAIAAWIASPDKAMKQAVVNGLPTMNPAGQLALLLVLADAADVSAPARRAQDSRKDHRRRNPRGSDRVSGASRRSGGCADAREIGPFQVHRRGRGRAQNPRRDGQARC